MAQTSSQHRSARIAIIGGGPIGLACALQMRDFSRPTIFESGSLCNTIRDFPDGMTFFSTAPLLSIGNHPFTSAATKPSKEEALHYYNAVAAQADLDLRLGTTVRHLKR